MRAFGLDKEAGLELDVTELASTEAGKIAIQGGGADIIVSDWLWVARERAQGAKLTLYPYSTGVGAVMTKDAAIKSVKDLAGKKLGVAGGPLDKSWLMLKAYALKQGVDLEKSATVLYGAPPLIAEKALQGELDAALEFWNFAADLEGKGFARAIEICGCGEGARRQGRRRRHRLCVRRRFRREEQGRARALLRHDDEGEEAHRHGRQGLGRRRAAHRSEGRGDARHLSQALYRGRSETQRRGRRRQTPPRSIACSPRSAARSSSARGKTLDPGTFYKDASAALIRLASLAALILLLADRRAGSPIRDACRVRSPSSTRS